MMKQLPYGMHLKLATTEDVAQIYDLMVESLKEAELPNKPTSFKSSFPEIETFVTNKDNVTILLCKEGELLGILAATKHIPSFFSRPYATEILWYVRDEGRKGRNPIRMIEAFEYWAKEKGCAYVKLGLLTKFSRRQMKRLNRMYKSKGYKDYTTIYYKEFV